MLRFWDGCCLATGKGGRGLSPVVGSSLPGEEPVELGEVIGSEQSALHQFVGETVGVLTTGDAADDAVEGLTQLLFAPHEPFLAGGRAVGRAEERIAGLG